MLDGAVVFFRTSGSVSLGAVAEVVVDIFLSEPAQPSGFLWLCLVRTKDLVSEYIQVLVSGKKCFKQRTWHGHI